MPSDEVHEQMPDAEPGSADAAVGGATDAAIHSAITEPRELTLSDIAQNSPFAVEAFAFLQRGLARVVEQTHGNLDDDEPHHVHGRDLCFGLRDLALEEFGPFAGNVLSHWGITQTSEFGEMVYLLVAYDVLAVSDDDRPEDFRDVYAFADAFG
ncbi:MAG: Minf_1886 family protein [Planctomycetota bacterium]